MVLVFRPLVRRNLGGARRTGRRCVLTEPTLPRGGGGRRASFTLGWEIPWREPRSLQRSLPRSALGFVLPVYWALPAAFAGKMARKALRWGQCPNTHPYHGAASALGELGPKEPESNTRRKLGSLARARRDPGRVPSSGESVGPAEAPASALRPTAGSVHWEGPGLLSKRLLGGCCCPTRSPHTKIFG